ncbi:hypothetical protein BKA81DRAFT_349373 [Phyllosticta paracitricarpa]
MAAPFGREGISSCRPIPCAEARRGRELIRWDAVVLESLGRAGANRYRIRTRKRQGPSVQIVGQQRRRARCRHAARQDKRRLHHAVGGENQDFGRGRASISPRFSTLTQHFSMLSSPAPFLVAPHWLRHKTHHTEPPAQPDNDKAALPSKKTPTLPHPQSRNATRSPFLFFPSFGGERVPGLPDLEVPGESFVKDDRLFTPSSARMELKTELTDDIMCGFERG